MQYCSACGQPVTSTIPAGDNRLRDVCTSCGTVHYQNPKIVAGCVPEHE
ncbi:MAG: NUDIX hydrolase, partial [Gammaproteobacteria bacterium]|nr:NUDIX hydrolase [Gammaproteobacteria bacterium]